jgi:hypothetical protein
MANQANDITVQGHELTDSVSCLCLNGTESTQSNLLFAGSWDGNVMILFHDVCLEIMLDL